MNTYTQNGARQVKLAERKKTKEHIKQYNRILLEMSDLAVQLKDIDKVTELTEDNIDEYVIPIYGRGLDSMEKMLVLGKLYYGKENNNE